MIRNSKKKKKKKDATVTRQKFIYIYIYIKTANNSDLIILNQTEVTGNLNENKDGV